MFLVFIISLQMKIQRVDFCIRYLFQMSKRVGRGTKRLADGKDADGAEEGGEREVESHVILFAL